MELLNPQYEAELMKIHRARQLKVSLVPTWSPPVCTKEAEFAIPLLPRAILFIASSLLEGITRQGTGVDKSTTIARVPVKFRRYNFLNFTFRSGGGQKWPYLPLVTQY